MRRVIRAILGGGSADDAECADEDVDAGRVTTYETDTDGSSYSVDVPAAALGVGAAGTAGASFGVSAEKRDAPAPAVDSPQAEKPTGPSGKTAAVAPAARPTALALGNRVDAAASAPAFEDGGSVPPSAELRTSLAAANLPHSVFGLDAKPPAFGAGLSGNAGIAAPPPTPARARYSLRSRKNDSDSHAQVVLQPAGLIAPANGRGVVPVSREAHAGGASLTAPVLVPSYTSLRPRGDASGPVGAAAAGNPAHETDMDDVNSHVVKYEAIDARLKEVEDASLESLRAICDRMGLPNSESKNVLRARARNACVLADKRPDLQRGGGEKGSAAKDYGPNGERNGMQGEHGDHLRNTRHMNVRKYEGEVVQQMQSESAREGSLMPGRGAYGEANAAAESYRAGADGMDNRNQAEQSNTRTTSTRLKSARELANVAGDGTPARASDGKCMAEVAKDECDQYATRHSERNALEKKSPHGITHSSTPGPARDPANTSAADASGGQRMLRGSENHGRRSTVKIPTLPRFIEDPTSYPTPSPTDVDQDGLRSAVAGPVSGLAAHAAAGGLCESVDAQFHSASGNELSGAQDQTSAAIYSVKEPKPPIVLGNPVSTSPELHGREASCPSRVRSKAGTAAANIRVSPSKEGQFSSTAGNPGPKLVDGKFETSQQPKAPNVSGNLFHSSPVKANRIACGEGAGLDPEQADVRAGCAPVETFLPPPPPTPADPSMAKRKNTNVVASLHALGKRGFVTMNADGALANSGTEKTIEAELRTRHKSLSENALAGLSDGKESQQADEKDSGHVHDIDFKPEPEKFVPPPEKKRRVSRDTDKLAPVGPAAFHDRARVSRTPLSQFGNLDSAHGKESRPGAPVDASKALLGPSSGTLAAAAASAALSATAVANAAAAAAAAAGSRVSLVERTGAEAQGTGRLLMTGGLPPRPPMPSPRAPQRTSAIPQPATAIGLDLPSNLALGTGSSQGDPAIGRNYRHHQPISGIDAIGEVEGRENTDVNEGTSSVRDSPLPRPVATKTGTGAGFVTPKDIIRTLQNRSAPRASSVFHSHGNADEGFQTPGIAVRENPHAFPGSSFGPVLRKSYARDVGDSDEAERYRAVTPYEATRRFSIGGGRSSRASLDLSLRRRRGLSTSSAIVTDLRPGSNSQARLSAPNELRVNALRVSGVEDGILGMNRPVAVSASAKKILASLDQVSQENRASAAKRVRSPLGRPPSSKRQRRSGPGSSEIGVDDEGIGGSKWFLNTIKAHAAAASSKMPRDDPSLARKSMPARQNRLGVGGKNTSLERNGANSERGDGDGVTSPARRPPTSSFRPLSRAEGGISKKRKQQRQNFEPARTRTQGAFSTLLANDYNSSLVPTPDGGTDLKAPVSFGFTSSALTRPEADSGTGPSSAQKAKLAAPLATERQELPAGSDSVLDNERETVCFGSNPVSAHVESKVANDLDESPGASETLPLTAAPEGTVSGVIRPSGPRRAAFGASVSSPTFADNPNVADDCGVTSTRAGDNTVAPVLPEVQESAGSPSVKESKHSPSQSILPSTSGEIFATKLPDSENLEEKKSESPGSQQAAPAISFGASAASAAASAPHFSGFLSTHAAADRNVPVLHTGKEKSPLSQSKSVGIAQFGLNFKQPEKFGDPTKHVPSANDDSSPAKNSVGVSAAETPLGTNLSASAPLPSLPFSFQIPATKSDDAPTALGVDSNATSPFEAQKTSGLEPVRASGSAIAPAVDNISSGIGEEKVVTERASAVDTASKGCGTAESQKESVVGSAIAPISSKNSEPDQAKQPEADADSSKNQVVTALPSKVGASLFSGMKPLPSSDNRGKGQGAGAFDFESSEDKAKETKPAPLAAGSFGNPEASSSNAPLFAFGSGGAMFGTNAGNKSASQATESGLSNSVFPASAPAVSPASSGPSAPASGPFSASGGQSGTPFSFANPSSASAQIASPASSPSLFSAPAIVPTPATGASASASASMFGFTGAQLGSSHPSQSGGLSTLNSAVSAAAPSPAAVAPAAPFGGFTSGGFSFNPPASGAPAFLPPAPGGNPFAASSLPPPSTSASPAVVFGAATTAATPFGGFSKPSSSPIVFSAPVPSAAQATAAAPSFGGNTSFPAPTFTFGAGPNPAPFGSAAPAISAFGAPGTAGPPANTLGAPPTFNGPATASNLFPPAPGMPGIGSGVDPASGSGFNMGRSTAPPTNTRRRTLRGRRSTPR